MIDREGYRLNVGIVVINDQGQLLWAKRRGMANAWQFPQGGMQENETTEQAMYRELTEELGLQPSDVELVQESRHWLKYRLPRQYRRKHVIPLCVGQKQKWFLLKLISPEQKILLDATPDPEFDQWRWVYYWYPVHHVILFKQKVYRRVLKEFAQTMKSIVRGTQTKG